QAAEATHAVAINPARHKGGAQASDPLRRPALPPGCRGRARAPAARPCAPSRHVGERVQLQTRDGARLAPTSTRTRLASNNRPRKTRCRTRPTPSGRAQGRNKMSGRRGHGEGSIHKRADGRWAATIDLGWEDGRRKRKTLYGKTRREV